MSSNNDIEIVVRGRIGSGKSTIATLIELALKEAGAPNVVLVEEDPWQGKRLEYVKNALDQKALSWFTDRSIKITEEATEGE